MRFSAGMCLDRLFEDRPAGLGHAGAEPGPVCYKKSGGLLAITDATSIKTFRVDKSILNGQEETLSFNKSV